MSAERASVPETTRATDLKNTSGISQLRIAEKSRHGKVHRLVELAYTLLKEAEFLARDKSFTDEVNRIQNLDVTEGLDFYTEVQRFEIGLIKRALEQTAGNQAKAAKLLSIKPTTLNSKIKVYNIEF